MHLTDSKQASIVASLGAILNLVSNHECEQDQLIRSACDYWKTFKDRNQLKCCPRLQFAATSDIVKYGLATKHKNDSGYTIYKPSKEAENVNKVFQSDGEEQAILYIAKLMNMKKEVARPKVNNFNQCRECGGPVKGRGFQHVDGCSKMSKETQRKKNIKKTKLNTNKNVNEINKTNTIRDKLNMTENCSSNNHVLTIGGIEVKGSIDTLKAVLGM